MGDNEFPMWDIQQTNSNLFLGLLIKESDGSYAVEGIFQGSAERQRKRLRYFAGLKGIVKEKEGEWVVGSINDKSKLTLLGQSSQELVQVIPWSIVDKGDAEDSDSAAAFFLNPANVVVPIKCNSDLFPLIGGLNNPGHIIIYDDGSGAYFKGFSHIGDGQIQCSDVKVLLKEGFRTIANDLHEKKLIEVFSMVFDASHSFLLLSTSQSKGKKRKKNVLLDSADWQSLPSLVDGANDGQDALSAANSGREPGSDEQVSEDEDGVMQQEDYHHGTGNNNGGSAVHDENQSYKDNGSDELGLGMWHSLDKVPASDPSEGEMPGSENADPNLKDDQEVANKDDDVADDPTPATNDIAPVNGGAPIVNEASTKNQSPPNDNLGANTNDDRSPEESEQEFLTHFKEYVKECGFNYNDRDLERFHTCVKTGMMTLLGGDPGSGKSSLFELYARALAGKSGECNFKRVDVNPTWMEPSDLMGYSTPNVNEPKGGMRFHESQCGLRRFLAELENQSERAPALVCFEEMNLARIELYFAEFIQVISRYEISADDKQLPSYGGNGTEGELAIPADIRFVGTCNEDPTVKPMSDRFLDRSNVIRLSGNNKAWKKTEEKDSAGKDEGQPENEAGKKLNGAEEKFCLFARKSGRIGECSSDRVSAENYIKWVKKPSQEDIQKVGAELDNILNQICKELSAIVSCPSQRVAGEILRYVANRPLPPGIEDDKARLYIAFDEALVQRVISKCVPNALMRGKFKAAANKVKETFKKVFMTAEKKEGVPGAEEKIVSLTAERLEELEAETNSLFQWGGVEDDSNAGNME